MPLNADEARQCPPLVRFSPGMREASTQLKRFLFKELYRHPQVNETTAKAKQVMSELFAAYVAQPSAMPADFAQREDLHRAVADYIAGMTDRFAVREHARLTGTTVIWQSLPDELARESVAMRNEVLYRIAYAGYLDREYRQIEKLRHLEQVRVPAGFDFLGVRGLRKEGATKLAALRPYSLGQASRISGVTPADISVLMVALRQQGQA